MPHKDLEKRREYHREYHKRYYHEHHEKVRKYANEWARKNKERVRESAQRSYYKYRDARIKANVRGNWERYHKLRAIALEHYGNKCRCCGETIPVFLAVHHIHLDGNQHRRQMKKEYTNIFEWLRKNNYPDGFEILCHNCNWAESHGGCPHRELQHKRLSQLNALSEAR